MEKMSNTFVRSLCIFAAVCTFKEVGNFIIRNEDEIREFFEPPKQTATEIYEEVEEPEELSDFELAKEEFEKTLEKFYSR